MLDIKKMSSEENLELLQAIGYGHLGCIDEGKPYVIPMQYYIKDLSIYIFTDRGVKSQDLDLNPDICLQVEELHNTEDWRSVTVSGRVKRLQGEEFIEIAQFITAQNPTFSPVINRNLTELDELENTIAIYRIHPSKMSGTSAKSPERQALVN